MIIVHRTKSIFKLGRKFEKSNSCMKFGRTSDKLLFKNVHKCKPIDGGHLGYGTKYMFELGQVLIKVIHT